MKKTCAVCRGPSVSRTCGYACANRLRSSKRAASYDLLVASVRPIPLKDVTDKQLAWLAEIVDKLEIKPTQHLLTIAQKLPPKALRVWLSMPGFKAANLRILSLQDFSKARCPACQILCTTSGKYKNSYCSQKCYAVKSAETKLEKSKLFRRLKRKARKIGYRKFGAEDVAAFISLFPERQSTNEVTVVSRLYEHDKTLALRYLRQRANSQKGRDRLARGAKQDRCDVCRKIKVLKMMDNGKRVRHCSNACAMRSEKRCRLSSRSMALAWTSGKIKTFKRTKVRLNGRTLYLQGFEPYVLPQLRQQFEDCDIRHGNVDRITYRLNGQERTYVPDFQIGKLLIEVKSTWTFLNARPDIFEANCIKAKACLAQGYRFRLMLLNGKGQRIKLPKHWYNMSKSTISPHVMNVGQMTASRL